MRGGGEAVERLDGVETVLLDLDGTLYVGSQVVEGAPEAVRRLRERGLAVRFCTNTDSVTPGELAERLAGRGFEVGADELVTPVAVAAQVLASSPEARVLAVAAGGIRRLLADHLAGPGEAVTHVLVADPSYGATYDDLDAAFRALRGGGAELLATQVNRVALRDDGEHLDTGGWVRLLEYATGRTARVLGKPSPEFFTATLDALGRGPETALVVGDDLEADVGGGRAVGAATVLVRSGKGDRRPPAGTGPDAVVDSVADLPGLLREG
jgi:HAD superfamily hydrolase (TIGR01458 family)